MRVKLNLMIAGQCRHSTCMVTGRLGFAQQNFPSLVGCITHPTRGTVLFDTGYGEAISRTTDPVARLYSRVLPYRLNPHEVCVHQLAAAGVQARDVHGIILSHHHPDHAGGLECFPDAKIYLSRAAAIAAGTSAFRKRCQLGLIRDLFPADLLGRACFVEDCAPVTLKEGWDIFGEGADIFGDASCIVVALPGHAPGHIGLKLRTDNDREVLLAADAAWLSRCYREMLEPLLPARFFIDDYGAYRRTLAKLHDFSKTRVDIAIVPSHCIELIEALRHAGA